MCVSAGDGRAMRWAVMVVAVNTRSGAGAVQNWNVKWLKKKNEQNKNGLNNNEAIKREHELEVVFFPVIFFLRLLLLLLLLLQGHIVPAGRKFNFLILYGLPCAYGS